MPEVAANLNEEKEDGRIEDLKVVEADLHHHPLFEYSDELRKVRVVHRARRNVELLVQEHTLVKEDLDCP